VFVLMPEGGIPGPPDRLAPFRFGSALIAIRTGARIVPLAIVGSKELYIGRRMATRVLAPTSAAALLGDVIRSEPPERGSRAELDLAHLLTERLAAVLEPVIEELYPRTVDPPDRPRRFRGLTWLFIARPKAANDRPDDRPADRDVAG
jgi:1-acyl-sn-glycerol-3-phosphate acyltransferase